MLGRIVEIVRPGRTGAFVHPPRPIVPEETGQRPVGQDPALSLADGTVVALVRRIHDPLHRRPAYRAWSTEAPVYRHLRAKRRDLLGKRISSLRPQTFRPFAQHRRSRLVETFDVRLVQ